MEMDNPYKDIDKFILSLIALILAVYLSVRVLIFLTHLMAFAQSPLISYIR